jgi:hypothetical protein
MIAISTAPIRFIPPWYEAEDPQAPVFHIRAGSVTERALLEAELSGEYRAAMVYDFQLASAFAEGISALLADDPGRDELIALSISAAAGDDLAPIEALRVAQARAILADHWPAYRSLLAQLARRSQLLPLIALRRFCTGWENVTNDDHPVPFMRGADGLVTSDAAGALPHLVLKVAGHRAYELLYAGAQSKNSDAPSKSGDAAPTSPLARPKKGGRSRAITGRKTRS